MACLDEMQLLALIQGEMSATELAGVEEHLDACSVCRELASEVARSPLAEPERESAPTLPGVHDQTAPKGLDQAEPSDGISPLPSGTRIGRYRILHPIGIGGMGVVYAAHDPQLGRRVAVKVVRTDLTDSTARARLLREARAMARLSHPNVVSVYDAGPVGDDLFVAMELVEGMTLGQWLRLRKWTWREILGTFASAGRGLAAAHAAGLVHRDFKPANVLVGVDGDVKVVDFGLARPFLMPETSITTSRPGVLVAESVSGLTRAGAMLGTPAYMAPEQLRGEDADARSDQFAFCVALFEALEGARPYPGDTMEQLNRSMGEGRMRSAKARMPRWLKRAIRRGLHPDPRQRFSSMDDLLQGLSRPPSSMRRWLAVAGVAVAVAGAAVWALRLSIPAAPRLCTAAGEKLQGVWDDARAQKIEAAFLATKRPYAPLAWARTRGLLDRYSRAWVDMSTESCRATHVRGEQSAALLDLRTWCLERRRQALRALTDLFGRADAAVVLKAVQAASALPKLTPCADPTALRSGGVPPQQPQVRKRVEALRARLAGAEALMQAGKYPEGLAAARSVVRGARAASARRVVASALVLQGTLEAKAGDADSARKVLEEAVVEAYAAGDDRAAVRAFLQLVKVTGYRQVDAAAARRWERYARAGIQRMGNDPDLRSQMEGILGAVRYEQGRYDEARRHFEECLTLRQKVFGPQHPQVADAHGGMGVVLWSQGRYPEAVLHHRRALAILEKTVGGRHPEVAVALNNLALVLWSQGRLSEALRLHARSLSIREEALGPDHLDVANALSNQGMVLRAMGRATEALVQYRRALAIREKRLGPDHPDVALTLSSMATALTSMGRAAEALPLVERAILIGEKRVGRDHPRMGGYLRVRARALIELGRFGPARASLRRALVIQRKSLGAGHVEVARALSQLGEASLGLGEVARAEGELQQALAIQEKDPRHPVRLAQTRFALARAYWKSGRQKESRHLARLAGAALRMAGPRSRRSLQKVQRWQLGKR